MTSKSSVQTKLQIPLDKYNKTNSKKQFKYVDRSQFSATDQFAQITTRTLSVCSQNDFGLANLSMPLNTISNMECVIHFLYTMGTWDMVTHFLANVRNKHWIKNRTHRQRTNYMSPKSTVSIELIIPKHGKNLCTFIFLVHCVVLCVVAIFDERWLNRRRSISINAIRQRYFLSDSFLIFVSVQMIREKSLLSNNKAKKHSVQITTTRKISEIDWHGIIMRMIPRYYPGIFVSMSHTFQFYASSSSDRGNVYTDQIRVNRLFFGDSEPIDLSLSMWIGEKAPARQSNHQYSIRSNSVQKYALIL